MNAIIQMEIPSGRNVDLSSKCRCSLDFSGKCLSYIFFRPISGMYNICRFLLTSCNRGQFLLRGLLHIYVNVMENMNVVNIYRLSTCQKRLCFWLIHWVMKRSMCARPYEIGGKVSENVEVLGYNVCHVWHMLVMLFTQW